MAMTSKSESEIDQRRIDLHYWLHDRSDICRQCDYIEQLNLKQECNGNSLRLIGILQLPGENVTDLAVFLLGITGFWHITNVDIFACRRVDSWDGRRDPQDILVTFRDKQLRDYVYNGKYFVEPFKNFLTVHVQDDLIPERIVMWKRAAEIFGVRNVDTCYGAIGITLQNEYALAYTPEQLERIIEMATPPVLEGEQFETQD